MTVQIIEADAVAVLTERAARVALITTPEMSHACFREVVKSFLQAGTMPIRDAVGMVAAGFRDVDLALRDIIADEIRSGGAIRPELSEFAADALFRPPVSYPPGNVTIRDWTRNITINILHEFALERWPGLKSTRNRISNKPNRLPSACSLVAQALGGTFTEARVEKIVDDHKKQKFKQMLSAFEGAQLVGQKAG